MRSFPLAPMSPVIRGLTAILLAIPPVLAAAAWLGADLFLLRIAAIVAAAYLLVWLLWRPASFQVGPEGLAVVWPLRRQLIPARHILAARPLEGGQIRQELGFALRIGVGGLWGAFGWHWTSRRGMVVTYASRVDGLVLIERRDGRPLLITPARPEEFVQSLQAALAAR